MAVQYIGDKGRVYTAISVGGKTLVPVPGQIYDIPDPADGRWTAVTVPPAPEPIETPVQGDTAPVGEEI